MFKVEITAVSLPELADKMSAMANSLLGSAASYQPTATAQVEPAAKASRTPKTKTEPKPEPKPELASEQPSDAEAAQPEQADVAATDKPATGAEPAAEAAPTVDFSKDIEPLVLKLVAGKGKPAAIAVLDQFGATRASEVAESSWAELKSALQDALA